MGGGVNFAAYGGHNHVIQWFCDVMNTDVNKMEFYLAPLHCATLAKKAETVKWLLEVSDLRFIRGGTKHQLFL